MFNSFLLTLNWFLVKLNDFMQNVLKAKSIQCVCLRFMIDDPIDGAAKSATYTKIS